MPQHAPVDELSTTDLDLTYRELMPEGVNPAFTGDEDPFPVRPPSLVPWWIKSVSGLAIATWMAACFGGSRTPAAISVSVACIGLLLLCAAFAYRRIRASGHQSWAHGKLVGWCIVTALWVVTYVVIALLVRGTIGSGSTVAYISQFIWAAIAFVNLLTFGGRWAPTRM